MNTVAPQPDKNVLTPVVFAKFLEDLVLSKQTEASSPEKLTALRQILLNVASFALEHQDRKRGMPIAQYTEATFKRALYAVSQDSTPLPSGIVEGSEEAVEYRQENARKSLEARKFAILNPGQNAEILTAHPTSSLDIDDIQRLQELQTYTEGMSVEAFEDLARKAVAYEQMTAEHKKKYFPKTKYSVEIESVRDLATNFYVKLDPAKKLTVVEETERAIHFAKQRYYAIPIMLQRMDEALDLVEPSLKDAEENSKKLVKLGEQLDALKQKLKTTKKEDVAEIERDIQNIENLIEFIEGSPRTSLSADDLRRMGKMMQTLSWQADQDSKDNVTAEVIEAAILKNKEATRALYEKSLVELLQQFNPEDLQGGHAKRRLQSLLKNLRNDPESFRAEEFIADLEMFKNAYEMEGGKFPAMQRTDSEGNSFPTRFSMLDALIVQVHNCGDCHPRMEIRQNATRHRNVLEYIRREFDVTANDKPEQIYKSLVGEDGARLRQRINERLTEIAGNLEDYRRSYTEFLKNVAKETDAANKARMESDIKKIKEQLDFYETMKTAELASKYPESVYTYVIAETGLQASKEAEGYVTKVGEVDQPMASDKAHDHIVNGAKQDVFSVMCFTKIMASEERYQEIYKNNQLTKIIPLMENRGSIGSAGTLLDELVTHSHFKNHIKHCSDNEPPQVYDPELGKYRVMTIAEAKIAMGADPDPERNLLQPDSFRIKPDDWSTPLKARTVVMFAGSDSFRENGLCIGPINQFNQQEQAMRAIASGIWVDIFNGTGGAVHRSNPAPYISSRRTVQGAENHYATPAAVAAANETYLATNILQREGYSIPEEHQQLVAAYPGHVANSLMLPMETARICAEAKDPLVAGCKAHAALFADKRYDAFFAKSTALEFTKWFNHSARPDARSDRPFSTDSLRAIGYNLSQFGTGANSTLYKGMYEFLDIQPDGSFNLERTLRLQQNSYKIQDMMTRATIGCALADFDNAWRYVKEVTRTVKGNEVTLESASGEKATLQELHAAFKEGKENYKGFSGEALVMAHFELEQRQVARAIYETYRTIQVGGPEKVSAKIRKEWSADTFDPKQLFDIMPPTMREEYKAVRQNLTEARHTLADHHAANADRDGKMEKLKPDIREQAIVLEKLYDAYLTITDGLESGSHLSQKNPSHTFNNSFAKEAKTKAGGANLKQIMGSQSYGYVISA